ncbi:MAG: hypothetical protein KJO18_07475, partial [Acidimicrobiia bacterium]|nr:hypothetical protein [Acidimicrobiia bacterium]
GEPGPTATTATTLPANEQDTDSVEAVASNEGAPPAGTATEPASEETPETASRPIIGEPTIVPVSPQPLPDRVSIEPGVVANLETSVRPTIDTVAEPSDGGGASVFDLDAPQVANPVLGAPQQPLNVGVWAEPETSHLAVITVGVNPGPEGLAELTLDFGDGSALDLDDRELHSLRDGGVVEVVHRFEPTLTPQRQRVVASVSDGAGTTQADSVSFTTRAEFLVRFSPLTVRSLGNCDLFGKGDFTLTWNIDGRRMSSEFKLAGGQSHVEERFAIGLSGVTFSAGYSISIDVVETDSPLKSALPGREFPGPHGPLFGDVLELGTHIVPVSIVQNVRGSSCRVNLDFTTTLAIDERTDV